MVNEEFMDLDEHDCQISLPASSEYTRDSCFRAEEEAPTTSSNSFATEINAVNDVQNEEAAPTTSSEVYAKDMDRISNVYNEVEAGMRNKEYEIDDIPAPVRGSRNHITDTEIAHLSYSIQ